MRKALKSKASKKPRKCGKLDLRKPKRKDIIIFIGTLRDNLNEYVSNEHMVSKVKAKENKKKEIKKKSVKKEGKKCQRKKE